MRRRGWMKLVGGVFSVLLWGLLAADTAGAVSLRISGPRVSIEARDAALRDVMAAFAAYGVQVRMDPAIDKRISVRIKDRELEGALEELVSPFSYALVWDQVEGPFGRTPTLRSVHVFRIGQEEAARPLEVSKDLRVVRGWDGTEHVADELLVGFAPGTTPEAFRLLLDQIGATVVDCDTTLGVYRLRFAPGTNIEALASQLAGNERIAAVEPNFAYKLPEARPVVPLHRPSSREAPAPREGAPALAILDSGLGSMDGLSASLAGTFDAFNPDGAISDPVGHGTQMALIASGAVTPAGGVEKAGGAPLLAIRAFDGNGYTSSADLMRAVNYALDNGARVLNLSWGTETESEFLWQTIAHAQQRNAVVVASVGNEPVNRPVYPAAFPGVLGVSATKGDGTRWEQSNFGAFVDLAAPGTADLPVGYNGPPGSYAGTSIAAGYASGSLAGYFAKHPGASGQDAVNALLKAVAGDTPREWNPHTGFGVLDAAALEHLLK